MEPHQLFFHRNPSEIPKATNRVILISLLLLALIFTWLASAMAARVVLNGAFITLSGGTSSTPVYLVVDTPSTAGITKIDGHIISEGEYNRVRWNVRTGTGLYTFPIGKGTTVFTPFVFDKTTAGTESGTGNVSIASWYTANNAVWPSGTMLCGIATDNDVVDRFWQINVQNYSANPTATVDFYYNTGEIQTIPQTELMMQRWNPSCCGVSACKWETPPIGTVNTTLKYVRVTGISDFSPWVMTRSSAPLPIELLYFKARWKDQQYSTALLEWKTASETNNDYFEIQRSTDAVNFQAIGTKPGAGNSSTTRNYEFTDQLETSNQKPETFLYYRLKQVDYNGSYTYSNIEALNAPQEVTLIAIYPNPSREYVDYLVFSPDEADGTVMAIDAIGKNVIKQSLRLKKGLNKQRLDTSHLSAGSYVLQLTANETSKTEKQFVINAKPY